MGGLRGGRCGGVWVREGLEGESRAGMREGVQWGVQWTHGCGGLNRDSGGVVG